jgi:hypothetical protein
LFCIYFPAPLIAHENHHIPSVQKLQPKKYRLQIGFTNTKKSFNLDFYTGSIIRQNAGGACHRPHFVEPNTSLPSLFVKGSRLVFETSLNY